MSKMAWIGGGVLTATAWCWLATAQQAYSGHEFSAPLGAQELITHFHDQPSGPIVLTMVDPQTRVLAVYHVGRDTGEVKLKSVRNFQLDLRLTNFNGGNPTPDEIQKMFDRQP